MLYNIYVFGDIASCFFEKNAFFLRKIQFFLKNQEISLKEESFLLNFRVKINLPAGSVSDWEGDYPKL